jgi:hypothetical protein
MRQVYALLRGVLVKVHPRTRPGGRVTDPADLPDGTAAYALRDIAYLQRAGPSPCCT